MTSPAPAPSALWTHAAAFGALWGAVEVTLGSFLHALRVPFAGPLLAATGTALLAAQRAFCARRGVSAATGLVAALVKGFSPAGAILGPMIAISLEGLLVELAFLPWPRSRVGAVLAGALVVAWSLAQPFFTQWLLYGSGVLDLYVRFLHAAAGAVGLSLQHGWAALGALAAAFLALGAALAAYGAGVGRRVAAGRRPGDGRVATAEADA